MSKDDAKNPANNRRLSLKEREYLDKVKFYKSQAESLKSTAKPTLKKDISKGKEIKVTDKIKAIAKLVASSDGPNLALNKNAKKY